MITIGKIAGPFGARGDVRIISMTDVPERFSDLKRVTLSDQADLRMEMDIETVRYRSGRILLKFEGCDSRRDAERLRGLVLQVPRGEAVPLPEGRYYVHDIIGLMVVTDSGLVLGSVRDVMLLKSNDVYVVQGERGEILIPAVREIVRAIDIPGGTVTIHPLEGLLD